VSQTGLEATTLLRSSQGFGNLIIGVTGNAMDDELADFLVGGADMVLSKPMRPAVLDLLIKHLLDHGSQSNRDGMKLVVVDHELMWKPQR
jgi:CheY-like chemotaxis protein